MNATRTATDRQLRATLRFAEKMTAIYESVGKHADAESARKHAALLRQQLKGLNR